MKRTKRLPLLATAVAAVWQLAGAPLFGAITGSHHDFKAEAWNPGGEICKTCHTPHNAKADKLIPLWNHNSTTASYTLYTSPTLTAADVGQPTASSKACLSCHDNTVALGAFGGNSTNLTTRVSDVNASANLGIDLGDDHPISFTYNTALATSDGSLFDPSVKTVPSLGGKTIANGMLIASKVECASCHDVHNKKGDAPTNAKLLVVNNTASALCMTCHDK